MPDAGKPYRILKLHDLDERCWGVVDRAGALIDVDGISLRMTKAEAQALAERQNSGASRDEAASSDPSG